MIDEQPEESEERLIEEFTAWTQSGLVAVALVVVAFVLAVASIVVGFFSDSMALMLFGPLLAVASFAALPGFFIVRPNSARVLIALGRYIGSVSEPGFHWANPLSAKQRKLVSLRDQSFTTPVFKVTDVAGNPIEISAEIVWRVEKPVQAVFGVENYSSYVLQEAEMATRQLGSEFPYEDYEGDRTSLRTHPVDIGSVLQDDLQERLSTAGSKVIRARVSHLAYAPEIADAMLRRQQAAAVVGARRNIVEGAVGVICDALDMFAKREVVDLDGERKAEMVSNLLVLLTRDQAIQEAIDAGPSD